MSKVTQNLAQQLTGSLETAAAAWELYSATETPMEAGLAATELLGCLGLVLTCWREYRDSLVSESLDREVGQEVDHG